MEIAANYPRNSPPVREQGNKFARCTCATYDRIAPSLCKVCCHDAKYDCLFKAAVGTGLGFPDLGDSFR